MDHCELRAMSKWASLSLCLVMGKIGNAGTRYSVLRAINEIVFAADMKKALGKVRQLGLNNSLLRTELIPLKPCFHQ